MAYDKILPVRSRLEHCVNYVLNHEKTDLSRVMEYIEDPAKTAGRLLETSINCGLSTAFADMAATKRRWAKEGGVLGYHLIHSFTPGEVTPEQAHGIGVEFAQRLLGARYEAVVATHLDHEHIHCHILFNSVSFLDGRKYQNTFKDYFGDIRGISNEVSRAHGLSVIEPQNSGRHYAEWAAEKSGKTTLRDLIRQDIDSALARSFTYKSFWDALARMGYEVKRGGSVKHTAIKPLGGQRFIRLDSLGEDYLETALQKRLGEARAYKPTVNVPLPKRRRVKQVCRPCPRLHGFRALYSATYIYFAGLHQRDARGLTL